MTVKTLATATLGVLVALSTASAGTLFVDNNVNITGYQVPGTTSKTLSSLPGIMVMGMATTFFDTSLSPEVLLAADEGTTTGNSGAVCAYSQSGARSVFASVINPLGIAVNPRNGDVYVGANGGTTLEEFGPGGGTPTVIATQFEGQQLGINSLAVDANGDVFDADNGSGEIIEYVGGAGSGVAYATIQDNGPYYGIALDLAGDVFITYANNTGGGVDKITSNGTVTSIYSAATSLPTSLAYDQETGQLFMSYLGGTSGGAGGVDVFTAGTGGTVTSTVTNYSTFTNGQYAAIAYQTPEPGTITTLLGGLLCFSLLRVRRARQ